MEKEIDENPLEHIVTVENRRYHIWKIAGDYYDAEVKVVDCTPHPLYHVKRFGGVEKFSSGSNSAASCDLGLSILADAHFGGNKGKIWAEGDELYRDFTKEIVAHHSEPKWEITSTDIRNWYLVYNAKKKAMEALRSPLKSEQEIKSQ